MQGTEYFYPCFLLLAEDTSSTVGRFRRRGGELGRELAGSFLPPQPPIPSLQSIPGTVKPSVSISVSFSRTVNLNALPSLYLALDSGFRVI